MVLRDALRAPSTGALLAAVLVVIVVAERIQWAQKVSTRAVDFHHMWFIAQQGRGADVYAAEKSARRDRLTREAAAPGTDAKREQLWTTGSPFLYATMSLLPASHDRALAVFAVLSALALLSGIALLGRIVGLSAVETMIAIGLAFAASAPTSSDVQAGNIGQLQVGLLAITLWVLGRDGRARAIGGGALLGALVLWKPNIAAVPPLIAIAWFWGGRREWVPRLILGGAGGAIAALLVGTIWSGAPSIWASWLPTLGELSGYEKLLRLENGNHSLTQLLLERTSIKLPGSALFVVLFALSAVALLRRPSNADESPRRDALAAALGISATLIAAPVAWLHYYTLLLPAQLTAVSQSSPATARVLGALTLLLVSLDPVFVLAGHRSPALGAAVVVAAAALAWLACAWAAVRRPGAGVPAAAVAAAR